MATSERGVQRDRVERVVTRQPAREVDLVAVAGAQQIEDRIDAGSVGIAVETAAPAPARHRRADDPVADAQLGAGTLEERASGTVAVHPDAALGVDGCERSETDEQDVGDGDRLPRRRSGHDPFEGVTELERAPPDPEPRPERVQPVDGAGAARDHEVGRFHADHGGGPPPDRRDRTSGGEPGNQRRRDGVGEAHPATVQARSPW